MKFSNAEYAITSAYEKELRNKRAAFEYETKQKKRPIWQWWQPMASSAMPNGESHSQRSPWVTCSL